MSENRTPPTIQAERSIEDEVRTAIDRLASQALSDPARRSESVAALFNSALSFTAGTIAVIARLRDDSRRHACGPGCAYCCSLLVTVSVVEVLVLLRHLRSRLGPEELREMRIRVAAADDITRGKDSNQRVIERTDCALLVDGRCSVYEVRPLVCRGYASYSWVACADAHRAFRPAKTMPLDRPLRASYGAASDGLVSGARAAGLPGGAVELMAALRIGLDLPDAEERWLAGENVFAAAADPDERNETEMKASINGKLLDTGSMDFVAAFEVGPPGTKGHVKEELYRDRDGSFFLAGAGGPDSYYARAFAGAYVGAEDLIPLTPAQARRWLEDHQEVEAIMLHFPRGLPTEPEAIGLTLPAEVRRKVEAAAMHADVSVEDWVRRAVLRSVAENDHER